MIQTVDGLQSWFQDAPDRYSTSWETGWPWGFAIGFAALGLVGVFLLNTRGVDVLMKASIAPALLFMVLLQLIVRHVPSDATAAWLYGGTLLVGVVLLVVGASWPGWVLAGGSAIYGACEAITRVAGAIPAPVPFLILILAAGGVWLYRR
ncbi:hypothetical protein FRIG_03740 [Frigoribacterium faeni]|uniref:hypothetical protein n=1 Tax=Frigoribacterium faeni TaxID=145483 RepID=UPI001FAD6A83|nr:hypothetical protein [Frigoribacterium faeni]MCJ0700253.1 hypothetical protein [Frigoribacterium faeni]